MLLAGSGFGFSVFRNHPLLERVVETPSPYVDLLAATRALRRERLFGHEPYVVLTANGSQRTRVALQALLSGGRVRVGFTEAPNLYRVPLRFDPAQSQISNNLRVVEALEHELCQQAYEPEVYFTQGDFNRALALLQQEGIEYRRPFAVFVTQTSVTQRKGWRPERFREVVEWTFREGGAQIVFVGAGGEAGSIDTLREPLPFSTVNLAGKTSLGELCAVLSLSDVGVTLDTGTLHLARAVGLPMVVIAPAWSPPHEWLPMGNPRFEVLKLHNLESAPEGYSIDEVCVEDVQAAMSRLLERFPLGRREGRRGLLPDETSA